MQLIEGYERVPPSLRGATLAIGNFDGVHRGHQALISRSIEAAKGKGMPAGVLVFEPHPRQFFRPGEPFFRLTPLPRKLVLFEALGLDMAAVLPFDAALAGLTAEAFIETILVGGFGVRHVVVGYDFHFGKGRAGTPDLLAEAGRRHGFEVTTVAPVSGAIGSSPGGTVEAFSSSQVRACLRNGRVEEAADILGHRWRVSGTVVGGAKRGTGLGFPTANIGMPVGTELGYGIFAVRVRVEAPDGHALHHGAAYYGQRPTFDDGSPVLEVFLLNFDGDLYGRAIEVEFVARVRGDAKFDSGEALARQMAADCADAARRLDALERSDPLAGLPLSLI